MSWYFRPADGSFNHQCDLDKTSCAVSYLIYRIYKRGQKLIHYLCQENTLWCTTKGPLIKAKGECERHLDIECFCSHGLILILFIHTL